MKVLDGIRVLDMGNFITAPLAAMMLAELGADVIKIERPGQGDPFRSFKDGNYSPQFQAHNRNKRSLTLDYTQPQGRDVFDRLVAEADVLLINIRPGVEKKLGVDYHRLHELNPALVYCSITGFGSSGPYSSRAAYDNVGQSASGWLSLFHQGSDARVAGPAVSDAWQECTPASGFWEPSGAVAQRHGPEGRGQYAGSHDSDRNRTAWNLFRHRKLS